MKHIAVCPDRLTPAVLAFTLFASMALGQAPYGVATVAGVPYDSSGDGGPATQASITGNGAAFRAGYLYLADGLRIRRISPNGIITTIAGLLDPDIHGVLPGFGGDGGPALQARIRNVFSIVMDGAGNLYFSDSGNNCVRKVTARVVGGVAQPLDGTEIVTTVAGTPTVVGNSNGNGLATSATMNAPRGLAVDASGALYIADTSNHNIRRVDANGTITTLTGTGAAGYLDGPAAGAKFNQPAGVAVDPATGEVYVADLSNNRVRKISAGVVSTVAGTGNSSALGNLQEGGAATSANVHPFSVKFAGGILYFVDSGVGMLRQVSAGGAIATVAGVGLAAYGGAFPTVGDGGPPLQAKLTTGVQDVALDGAGGFFITDSSAKRIRFVAGATGAVLGQSVVSGTIATVAGPSAIPTFGGDGGPASSARLSSPAGITVDPAGNLYISDTGNSRVRKVDLSRTIATFAGSGVTGFAGVPGPATAAQIQPGGSLAYDSGLYLTSNGSHVVGASGGFLSLVANATGATSPAPADGASAASAKIGVATVIADRLGNLYVGDTVNNRIWKIDAAGTVRAVAGNVAAGQTQLFGPGSIAFDARTGNLYATDGSQNRIVKISPNGSAIVFAGTGTVGFSGDGGPATAANLSNGVSGLVVDAAGNLYFFDGSAFRVRKVDTNGIITTVAGSGAGGYAGDGGPATSARMRGGPLAIDSYGNLYFSEVFAGTVRILDNIPPVVAVTATKADGSSYPANTWTNQTATVQFSCSDNGAGVASCPAARVLSSDGVTAAVSGTATDRAGNQATAGFGPVKIDKTPPVLSGMPGPGCSLWPPNGKMVRVATVSAADATAGVAPGSFTIAGASNEPPSASQISIVPNGAGGYDISLQADRLGTGTGRVYTLTATATDLAGNVATATATCVVPHDQAK
jgi:DNA-binding beta-propeller fold protein YncE